MMLSFVNPNNSFSVKGGAYVPCDSDVYIIYPRHSLNTIKRDLKNGLSTKLLRPPECQSVGLLYHRCTKNNSKHPEID